VAFIIPYAAFAELSFCEFWAAKIGRWANPPPAPPFGRLTSSLQRHINAFRVDNDLEKQADVGAAIVRHKRPAVIKARGRYYVELKTRHSVGSHSQGIMDPCEVKGS